MSQDTWHTLQAHFVGFRIFVWKHSTVCDIIPEVAVVKCSHGISAKKEKEKEKNEVGYICMTFSVCVFAIIYLGKKGNFFLI